MHCIKENTWEHQKMRLGQPFAIFTSKVSTPYPTASSGLPFANFACCPAVLWSPFASRWECSHPVHEGDRERPRTSKTGKATRKLPGSPTQTTGQNRSWRVERIQATGWKVFVFGYFWDVSPRSPCEIANDWITSMAACPSTAYFNPASPSSMGIGGKLAGMRGSGLPSLGWKLK